VGEESIPIVRTDALQSPEQTRPIEIWVIEDEESVRSLAVDCLQRDGYQVTAFDNADAALLELQKIYSEEIRQPPQLIITDIQMPGTTGDVFASYASIVFPNIPIIMMSGNLNTEPIAQRVSAVSREDDVNIVGTIAKPFNLSDFRQLVAEKLSIPDTIQTIVPPPNN
jgi:two-component system nitrogen regulation response regulator GlnG